MPAAGLASYHPSPSPGARTLAATTSTGELIATDPVLAQHLVSQNATAQAGMAAAIPGAALAGPFPSVRKCYLFSPKCFSPTDVWRSVSDVAIGAKGLGFGSRVVQIGERVANGLPSL